MTNHQYACPWCLTVDALTIQEDEYFEYICNECSYYHGYEAPLGTAFLNHKYFYGPNNDRITNVS